MTINNINTHLVSGLHLINLDAPQIRRLLKSLPTFSERLEMRRKLNQNVETIAAYVFTIVEQSRNPMNRSKHKLTDVDVPQILTANELSAYRRLACAKWAEMQRKELQLAREAREDLLARKNTALPEANESEKLERQIEKTIRRLLKEKHAIQIAEVARRLGVTISVVRQLHESGKLPSAGYVSVQYSRGKRVYLWLPASIIRYLNRRDQ